MTNPVPTARLIAYYLPQFHPVPENDEWWGPGFTEWTNVTKAKPLFLGHAQPKVPGELGYYDLRDAEVQRHQADLASRHGIEGFCYWHYWFGGGRRILERPFEAVLKSGSPKFPFCLSWANQSWTGIWHGSPKRILIEQCYPSSDDERRHFENVLPAFLDPRYIRVDDKPVFLVLQPSDHPDIARFTEGWRRLAATAGLPGVHFVGMSNDFTDPALDSFDAVTPFGPGDYLAQLQRTWWTRLADRIANGNVSRTLRGRATGGQVPPRRYDYGRLMSGSLKALPIGSRYYPCVIPNWDNTPRSGSRGVVVENSSAELFGAYLRKAIDRVADRQADRRIVFVKAWNEWAEGNYLEPDLLSGDAYLKVVSSVVFDAE